MHRVRWRWKHRRRVRQIARMQTQLDAEPSGDGRLEARMKDFGSRF
jgi:hypothetical protein